MEKKARKLSKGQELVSFYDKCFLPRFSTPPAINWAACTMAANKLLKHHDINDLKQLMLIYFESEGFFRQAGYRFLLFPTWLQTLATHNIKHEEKYYEPTIPGYKC